MGRTEERPPLGGGAAESGGGNLAIRCYDGRGMGGALQGRGYWQYAILEWGRGLCLGVFW